MRVFCVCVCVLDLPRLHLCVLQNTYNTMCQLQLSDEQIEISKFQLFVKQLNSSESNISLNRFTIYIKPKVRISSEVQ